MLSNILIYYKSFWTGYVNFKGRASKAAFWWPVGINLVLMFALTFQPVTQVSAVFDLITFLPTLSLLARRLHDVGKPTWWILIPFIPVLGIILIFPFLITRGVLVENEYGPPPEQWL